MLSATEADLLRILRLYDFGDFTLSEKKGKDGLPKRKITVRKQHGEPYQVVLQVSVKLDEKKGLQIKNSIIVGEDSGTLEQEVRSMINNIKTNESG